MQKIILILLLSFLSFYCNAQAAPLRDTTVLPLKELTEQRVDTSLRIMNLNPYFSLHVDSSLSYQLLINKPPKQYFWYLKNAPAGLVIGKDNGMLYHKANKDLFRSGRLKYDREYKVDIGVQSLANPYDKADTSFTITWYNTDVILPSVKASVVSPITIDEGNKVVFNVMCENGNFPIDKILFSSSQTISHYKLPKECDDSFEWTPPYEFVTDADKNKERSVDLYFIGTTKFNYSDTTKITIIVKESLNYDIATREYREIDSTVKIWVKQLKFTFLNLDKKIRKTKAYRSGFDITTASAGVTSTVLATQDAQGSKNAAKVIPSVGAALVPVKEAAAPNKSTEQNQASTLRSNIKRLEYILTDTRLSGDRDPLILSKTETLKKELRQSRNELLNIPTEIAEGVSDAELEKQFNSKKIQKKYRLK